MPDDPVATIVAGYREALETLAHGGEPSFGSIRATLGSRFTRGHFARAV
jgi:hypothetical protein